MLARYRKKKKKKPKRLRYLQCVLCPRLFDKEDVERGRYCIESMVCGYCYAEMQQKPYELSCFGKPTVVYPSESKVLGYSLKSEECQRWCPDRFACARIIFNVKRPKKKKRVLLDVKELMEEAVEKW